MFICMWVHIRVQVHEHVYIHLYGGPWLTNVFPDISAFHVEAGAFLNVDLPHWFGQGG